MEVDDEFKGAVGNWLVWMTLNNHRSIWKLMTNKCCYLLCHVQWLWFVMSARFCKTDRLHPLTESTSWCCQDQVPWCSSIADNYGLLRSSLESYVDSEFLIRSASVHWRSLGDSAFPKKLSPQQIPTSIDSEDSIIGLSDKPIFPQPLSLWTTAKKWKWEQLLGFLAKQHSCSNHSDDWWQGASNLMMVRARIFQMEECCWLWTIEAPATCAQTGWLLWSPCSKHSDACP